MVYEGPGTDINHGEKIVDKYGFLTNTSLITLKTYGNLLVSLERFDNALEEVAKIKYKKTLNNFRKRRLTHRERILLGRCNQELKNELSNLTGYSDFTYRTLEPEIKGDPVCIVIDAVNKK